MFSKTNLAQTTEECLHICWPFGVPIDINHFDPGQSAYLMNAFIGELAEDFQQQLIIPAPPMYAEVLRQT